MPDPKVVPIDEKSTDRRLMLRLEPRSIGTARTSQYCQEGMGEMALSRSRLVHRGRSLVLRSKKGEEVRRIEFSNSEARSKGVGGKDGSSRMFQVDKSTDRSILVGVVSEVASNDSPSKPPYLSPFVPTR